MVGCFSRAGGLSMPIRGEKRTDGEEEYKNETLIIEKIP